jgi:hypothetical protein
VIAANKQPPSELPHPEVSRSAANFRVGHGESALSLIRSRADSRIRLVAKEVCAMKRLAYVIALFALVVAPMLALAADSKADPSQYPLTVHVSSAASASPTNYAVEILAVTIDGKHYQLAGTGFSGKVCCSGLINLGDYHAKLTKDQHKTSYESLQQYEILFPDGSTRKFDVIAQSEQ